MNTNHDRCLFSFSFFNILAWPSCPKSQALRVKNWFVLAPSSSCFCKYGGNTTDNILNIFVMLGTRYQVLATRYKVLGTRYQIDAYMLHIL